MKITKEFIRNLIIYGLIGGFSALLDWGVLALLHEVLGMNEFVANVISVHCGIFTSFMLNRHINYKKKDKTAKRFASFYVIGLLGLGLSSLILLGGRALEISVLWTKAFSVVFVAGVQFLLNNFLTFRK